MASLSIKAVPDFRSIRPDIERGKRMLLRLARMRDAPEPVAAWRAVPEEALSGLTVAEKIAFIEALIPLVRKGRRVERKALRRVYQLFSFMQMPEEARLELLIMLHTRLRLAPERLPVFNPQIRRAILMEAAALAGRRPSAEAREYLARLGAHLRLQPDETRRWTAFFEHLTEAENRVASMLGKRGHVVRLNDRKLELFKKAVASIGVPAAVLFPLGTVGLSAEGIGTGLVALGGGFLLPAGIAMITGLGVAVALGVSTKKILDLVMPTTDADRLSMDAEKLNRGSLEIERILEGAASAEPAKIAAARVKVAEIIREIIPLSEVDRAKLATALDHARALGTRYIDYLVHDRDELERRNQFGAEELEELLELDRAVMS
jgi:hypothetical protein